MNGKYVLVIWIIFLTLMGFYIINPRTLDDIKVIDLNQHASITFNITQKSTFGSDGITKSTSNIEIASKFLNYMKDFSFRKPFRVNYDKINSIGPSYNILITDSNGNEILYMNVIGSDFMSMNDKKGTLRNYISRNGNLFDFDFFDEIYNSI